jgi:hypothetical protein
MGANERSAQSGASAASGSRASGSLSRSGNGVFASQDLVDQIADRVYALWLEDMRIEGERARSSAEGMTGAVGGS